MLFQPEHIDQIRTGEKTATRRDWDRPQAVAGNVYQATTDMFVSHDECDCYIRATDVYQQPLGEMSERDAQLEGGYSLAEFRDLWRDLNGAWDPDALVTVVEFDYAGREPVIYARSQNTGQYYKLFEWDYEGDGQYVSKEKTPVKRSEVPECWLDRLETEVTADV